MEKQYYVYELVRPDGRVFYVGKGTGKRLHNHSTEARRSCQCHKCRVIRKIWASGTDYSWRIVFTTPDEQAAYDKEVETISHYGIRNLTNASSGGGVGYTRSEETRALISTANKNPSPETRARLSIAAKLRGGHPHTPESRAKIAAKSKARGFPAQAREKARQWHLANGHTPESRAKISASLRAKGPEWSQAQAERARKEIARRFAEKTEPAGIPFTCARPGCGVEKRRPPSRLVATNYCCCECSAQDRPRLNQIRREQKNAGLQKGP